MLRHVHGCRTKVRSIVSIGASEPIAVSLPQRIFLWMCMLMFTRTPIYVRYAKVSPQRRARSHDVDKTSGTKTKSIVGVTLLQKRLMPPACAVKYMHT